MRKAFFLANLSKNVALSGSILGLALAMGVTAAEAKQGKSQASEHMSQTAKDKLESLGFPGNTGKVVDAESKDDEETKDEGGSGDKPKDRPEGCAGDVKSC
ncbi:hypothetical protein [Aliiruegeria sabulilitoris]|uniref:hypothetical protein n=1 Tax=Aliiruegeria sabulilitoris TaxID=1510458 RepID=UPI00083726CB|nr:hypothetical protein [Aliiruegeria sabulilitoris]NDR58772.1 hypothetical protein [Pseudoruegeria sp. M32A2M]